jgi:glyoxylase-like metal-dependent hydrolase (beta-lactamase superfamily II)
LENLEIEVSKIKLIVITHAHTDNYGVASEIKELYGIPVLVQRQDANRMIRGVSADYKPVGIKGRIFSKYFYRESCCPKSIKVEPDIIVDDSYDLSDFGISATVFHTPGHTCGSLSVLTKDGDLILSDQFQVKKGSPSRLTAPLICYDLKQSVFSLKKMSEYAPKKIYTASGYELSYNELQRFILKHEGTL